MDHPFDAISLEDLRRRRSAKWAVYPDDVLPAWVAEMDVPLAPPIARALHDAVDRGDAGYASADGLAAAFAPWAERRFGWSVAPRDVFLVCDVVTGLAETLRVATSPGDGVVIEPPVYPPFASTIRALGRRVVDAPLAGGAHARDVGWRLDLDAIARAYASGAKAHVLCSPHNPTGIVHDEATLAEVGRLARRHGVLVLADEIHAPLTLPSSRKPHVPYPLACARAGVPCDAVVLTSASKAYNLAGLKAALLVAQGTRAREVLAALPPETPFHAGHFGVIAACAAFGEECDGWLEQVRALLDRNRALLRDLLARALPTSRVGYVPPEASYLAWLDFRALGLGVDPARALLDRGRVALSSGPTFGVEGEGFARLNIGTTRALLEESVRRIAAALA